MAFRQMKDLIEWIAEFHETLERQYGQLADKQDDERMQMTLKFLASR